jgi:hypothetical protein
MKMGLVLEASFELVQEVQSISFVDGDVHVEAEATAGLGDVLEKLIGELKWRARLDGGWRLGLNGTLVFLDKVIVLVHLLTLQLEANLVVAMNDTVLERWLEGNRFREIYQVRERLGVYAILIDTSERGAGRCDEAYSRALIGINVL